MLHDLKFYTSFCRLLDEYTKSQSELKQLLHEKQTVHDKFQLLLAELRGELLDKTREVEELKSQVRQYLLLSFENVKLLVLYNTITYGPDNL